MADMVMEIVHLWNIMCKMKKKNPTEYLYISMYIFFDGPYKI